MLNRAETDYIHDLLSTAFVKASRTIRTQTERYKSVKGLAGEIPKRNIQTLATDLRELETLAEC